MKLTGQYAKFLTAAAGQALLYLQYTYGSGNHWVTLATAAAASLGVLAVPNTPKPLPPLPPAQPSNMTITKPPPA